MSNLMEVNILEQEKARQKKTIDSPLDVWPKFLATSTKEECMEYAAQNSGVNDACVVLKALSADEKMRLEAEARIKAWRDEEDRMEGAREEGELNYRKKTAIVLLDAGTPEEVIKKATGFSINDIRNFKD